MAQKMLKNMIKNIVFIVILTAMIENLYGQGRQEITVNGTVKKNGSALQQKKFNVGLVLYETNGSPPKPIEIAKKSEYITTDSNGKFSIKWDIGNPIQELVDAGGFIEITLSNTGVSPPEGCYFQVNQSKKVGVAATITVEFGIDACDLGNVIIPFKVVHPADHTKPVELPSGGAKADITIKQQQKAYKTTINIQNPSTDVTIKGEDLVGAGLKAEDATLMIKMSSTHFDTHTTYSYDIKLTKTDVNVQEVNPLLAYLKFSLKEDVKFEGNDQYPEPNSTWIKFFLDVSCSTALGVVKVIDDKGTVIVASSDIGYKIEKAQLLYFKLFADEGATTPKKGYVDKCYSTPQYDPTQAQVVSAQPIDVTLAKVKIEIRDEDGQKISRDDATVEVWSKVAGETCLKSRPDPPPKKKDKISASVSFTARELGFPEDKTELCIHISRQEFIDTIFVSKPYNAYKDGISSTTANVDPNYYSFNLPYAKIKIKIEWNEISVDKNLPVTVSICKQEVDQPFSDCEKLPNKIFELSGIDPTKPGVSGDNSMKVETTNSAILLTIRADRLRINDAQGNPQPLPNGTYLFVSVTKPHFTKIAPPPNGKASDVAHLKYQLIDGSIGVLDDDSGTPDEDNNIYLHLEFAKVMVKIRAKSGSPAIPVKTLATVKVFKVIKPEGSSSSYVCGSSSLLNPPLQTYIKNDDILTFTADKLGFIEKDTYLYFEVDVKGYNPITCPSSFTGDTPNGAHIKYNNTLGGDSTVDDEANKADEDNDTVIEVELVNCQGLIEQLKSKVTENITLYLDDKKPNSERADAIIKAAYYQWLLKVVLKVNGTATCTFDPNIQDFFDKNPIIGIFLFDKSCGDNISATSWLTGRVDNVVNLVDTTLYGLFHSGTNHNQLLKNGGEDDTWCNSVYNTLVSPSRPPVAEFLSQLRSGITSRDNPAERLDRIAPEKQVKRLLLSINKVPCSFYKGGTELCKANLHKEYCINDEKNNCVYADLMIKETFCTGLCREDLCTILSAGTGGTSYSCRFRSDIDCNTIGRFLGNEVPNTIPFITHFSICTMASQCFPGGPSGQSSDGLSCVTSPAQPPDNAKSAEIVCGFLKVKKSGGGGQGNECQGVPICKNDCSLKDYQNGSQIEKWTSIQEMLNSSIKDNRCLNIEKKGSYYNVEGVNQLFHENAEAYVKAACEYQPGCRFDSNKKLCVNITQYARSLCTSQECENKLQQIYTKLGTILQLLNPAEGTQLILNDVVLTALTKHLETLQSQQQQNLDNLITWLDGTITNLNSVVKVPIEQECKKLCAGLLGRAIYYYDIALEKKNGGKVTEAVAAALKGYAFAHVLSVLNNNSQCKEEFNLLNSRSTSIYKGIPPTSPQENLDQIIDTIAKNTSPALFTLTAAGAIDTCNDNALNAFSNAIESRIQIDNFKDKDGCGREGQKSDYSQCLTSALATFDPNACGNFSKDDCPQHPGCKLNNDTCEPNLDYTLKDYCAAQGTDPTKCQKETVCEPKTEGEQQKCVPKDKLGCDAFNSLPLDPQIRGKLCNGNNECEFNGGQCKKKEQKKCGELAQKDCEDNIRCWWVGQGESGKCREIQRGDCAEGHDSQQKCEGIKQGGTIKCRWCKDLQSNRCIPKNEQCSATPTTTPSPSACSAGSKEECEGKGCEWKDGNCQPKPGTTTATSLAAGICPSSFQCKDDFSPGGLSKCGSDFGGAFDLSKDEDKIEYAAHLPKRMISTSFNPVDICKWYGNEEAIERAKTLRNELRFLISSVNPWSSVTGEAQESYKKWAQEVYTAYKKACEFLNKGGCTSPSARATEVLLTTTYNYLKACGIESERDPDYPRRLANCARKGFPSECSQLAGTFVQELQWVQKKCKDTQAKDCSNSASLINLVISLMKSGPGIDISGVCK